MSSTNGRLARLLKQEEVVETGERGRIIAPSSSCADLGG